MPFKTLLVHVEATPESDLRVAAAVDLAKALGAALQGVGGCAPLYIDKPWIATYPDGGVIQALIDQEAADLKEAEARFRRLSAPLGEAAIWAADNEYPDRALELRAAGADLIVTSVRRGPETTTAAAADLVMHAGVPVLALPASLDAIPVRRIVVAWKNTREARRAVSDALPFLLAAEEVTVISAPDGDAGAAAADLDAVLGRLQRQGVAATGVKLDKAANDPVGAFLHAATDRSTDLIVAGAYGHTRLREWMLGGFTRGLLDRSPVPVLFSH